MLSRVFHGSNNFQMRSTATQYSGKAPSNLLVGWIRVLVQKRLRGQDDAAHAVSALRRLLVDEGLLNRMRMPESSEPFQRDDLPGSGSRDRGDARADGFAAGKNCTRPALTKAATESRAIQTQIIPQNVQQRSCRIHVNRRRAAVDSESDSHVVLRRIRKMEDIRKFRPLGVLSSF
jgi:hypothetical protein